MHNSSKLQIWDSGEENSNGFRALSVNFQWLFNLSETLKFGMDLGQTLGQAEARGSS
jgi:hypothetical protein